MLEAATASLAELAQWSDILIVASRAAPENRHQIDAGVLHALGPSGVLVNISRGFLVDEDALIAALRNGTVGGAALDVFEQEPGVPPALLALSNVVVSPHMGSRTEEAREAMGRLVIDNLVAHFEGRPLPSRVA